MILLLKWKITDVLHKAFEGKYYGNWQLFFVLVVEVSVFMVIPTGDFQNLICGEGNGVWPGCGQSIPARARINSIEWQPHRKPTQFVMNQCSVL